MSPCPHGLLGEIQESRACCLRFVYNPGGSACLCSHLTLNSPQDALAYRFAFVIYIFPV